ncbi:hypothetical protein BDF19DRAFT_416859 [Syncephalis fuscata]|nr:hypothetical protein BDF19DRAFT_416859 [Syncephalis fuscata]
MLSVKTRQDDPKRLIIVRSIVIFFILASLVIITIIQAKKAANPVYIYQTSESAGAIPIPTIIFNDLPATLFDVSIQVTGEYIDAIGAKRYDKTLTSALKRLRWGEDVVEILDTNFKHVNGLVGASNVWSFQPPPTWQFTPAGQFNISDTSGQKNITEVTITITAQHNILSSNRTENRGRIDVYLVEDPEALYSARRRHKPFDLSSVGGNLKTTVSWENKRKINFRYFEDHLKDEKHVRYDVHSELGRTEQNVATIVLSAQNPTASDKRYFVYEIRKRRANFSWLDCFGSIGGALTFSLALFAFLFGQRRVRPWGIIQRYIFRNRILGKFPRSVVEISSMSMSRNRATAGHDPVFNQDGVGYDSKVQLNNRQHSLENTNELSANISNYNYNQLLTIMNSSVNPPGQPMAANNEVLVQEVTELKSLVYSLLKAKESSNSRFGNLDSGECTNMRISELESFRQRVESFYLTDDLFYKHENQTVNRRSAVKTISELNW